MCGIAGFLGTFEAELLGRMGATIAHRGPDDAGVWHEPAVGVGMVHRRLAILDLAPRGRQPMFYTRVDGAFNDLALRVGRPDALAVAFNGEIYNFRELRAELEAKGCRFTTTCDTEVLLAAYTTWGDDCLARFNGMFAFALWDPARRRLLVARDAGGVKPLYLCRTPRGILFASELKALLCAPDLSRTLDGVALKQYVSYLYCPAPRTILSAVRKLHPGSALAIEAGGVDRTWTFAHLPYEQPIARVSPDEAAGELRRLLSQAVRRQMVADVPVGAFLSGGLDSSSLVALARQHANDGRIDCFTIGFRDGSTGDDGCVADLPYAEQAARHLGQPLHTIWVGSEMARGFERMIWQLDEPLADPAALNVLYISRLARQHGVKVLLSGSGGDDIFTGYRRHYALMQERCWGWLPRHARVGLKALAGTMPQSHPMGRRLAKAFRDADLDAQRRLAGYFLWLAPAVSGGLFSAELQADNGAADPLQPCLDLLATLPPGTPRLNQMLALDSQFFLADHNLNYTDKMSMATGLEVRVPFLDPDLTSFAARLPVGLKQHGAVGKWIFKRAMEPLLPREVIYRSKTGFGVPLRSWMQNELRDLVGDALSPATLRSRGIFDPGAVQRLADLDRAGRIDASYPLFQIICIETWCRVFLDRRGVMPADAPMAGN